MTSLENELRLLKQKVDLLIDGYQVLYMKIDQQNRILRQVEAGMIEDSGAEVLYDDADQQEHKVVRMSDRFLEKVRKNLDNNHPPLDPDDKTLA